MIYDPDPSFANIVFFIYIQTLIRRFRSIKLLTCILHILQQELDLMFTSALLHNILNQSVIAKNGFRFMNVLDSYRTGIDDGPL